MSKENSERYQVTPATHVILLKDENVLLLKRFNTGVLDGQFDTIAGHVDEDETFLQAAVREAEEEAGVTIQPNDLQFVHVVNIQTQQGGRVHVFFSAQNWNGVPSNCEPPKCDEINWFPIDDLPKNTSPHVAHAIKCIQNGQMYSEFEY